MNYYEMYNNNIGIGVINSNNFKFLNTNTNEMIIVPQDQATCIQYNQEFYCTINMPLDYMSNIPYTIVELISITKQKYDEFLELQDEGREPEIIYPEPQPQSQEPIQQQQQQPKMTIQEMRDKIAQQDQQIKALTNYILGLE